MVFKSEGTLPEGYAHHSSIDLVKSKKELRLVTLLSFVLAVVVAIAGYLFAPIHTTFILEPSWLFCLKLGITSIGMLVYLVGHEAVHGVVMWVISHVKPHFGLTLMYAYAGSNAYFGKAAYLVIALAPVVVWGAVLSVICAVLPIDWFWVCFIIQVFNFSGAAGDFYVTYRVAHMPADVLINDTGTAMTAYSQQQTVVQA